MEALIGSEGSFMDARREENMDPPCCCCRRTTTRTSLARSGAPGACPCLVAGLLVLLVTAVLTLSITTLFAPCAQARDSDDGRMTGDKYPRALLTAEYSDATSSRKDKVVRWESRVGNAFCNGGFNYSDGNLTVPVAGYYNLMVQIAYQYKANLSCPRSNTIKLSYQVLVYRESYKEYKPLISAVETVNCSMEYWRKSLHVSGLFNLESNCKLKVISSHTSLIVKEESLTFFGVQLGPP